MKKALDSLVPYPTWKIARIKDTKLGLLRQFFLLLIFLYIVVYELMWVGAHLEAKPLSAVYQVKLDHPTRNHCSSMDVGCEHNFQSLASLPYCAQSPIPAKNKLPCQLRDAPEMAQVTDEGIMVPTRVADYFLGKGCHPTAANNFTCEGPLENKLNVKGQVEKHAKTQKAAPVRNNFIADVERFTLLIDHSVGSSFGQRYYAPQMHGTYMECTDQLTVKYGEKEPADRCKPRPIECAGKCSAKGDPERRSARPSTSFLDTAATERSSSFASEKSRARTKRQKKKSMVFLELDADGEVGQTHNEAPEETLDETVSVMQTDMQMESGNRSSVNEVLDRDGVVKELAGDMFLLGKLLNIANVSLDTEHHRKPSWIGGDYRSSGFVLIVRISYTNAQNWMGLRCLPWNILGPAVHYSYRVTKHSSQDDYALHKVREDPKTKERLRKDYHGIRILIQQNGSIKAFDNIQLILICTTTIALLALANFITDTLALNCMQKSEEYFAIKFEQPMKRRKKRHEAGMPSDSDEAAEAEGGDNVQRYSSLTM